MAPRSRISAALSPKLEKELHRLPPGALLAFDFDGTLAPIRRDPYRAALPSRFARTLARLVKTYPIAIVSGRSLADLEEKFPNHGFHLVGSHGFETKLANGRIRGKAKTRWSAQAKTWKQRLEKAVQADPDLRGAIIEDKGHSLSIHFRGLRHADRAIAAARALAQGFPHSPRIVGGHFVLNLVPRDSANKGEALQALMKETGAKSALFIGDDVTDEHVFEKRIPGVLGIRILAIPGKTKARHVLTSRVAILPILRILARNHA
jgi:trehalose 6-phosphate phosphatase